MLATQPHASLVAEAAQLHVFQPRPTTPGRYMHVLAREVALQRGRVPDDTTLGGRGECRRILERAVRALDEAPAPEPPASATRADPTRDGFERAFDEGIDALLRKDYGAAAAASPPRPRSEAAAAVALPSACTTSTLAPGDRRWPPSTTSRSPGARM